MMGKTKNRLEAEFITDLCLRVQGRNENVQKVINHRFSEYSLAAASS